MLVSSQLHLETFKALIIGSYCVSDVYDLLNLNFNLNSKFV